MVLAVIVSAYAYFLIREAGHLVAMLLAGVRVELLTRYGVVPVLEISRESQVVSNSTEGLIIIAGPAMALLIGYLLFLFINRHRGLVLSRFGPVPVFVCYLTLMLDPIYYSVIPPE